MTDSSIIRDLRDTRVLVMHPQDSEGEELTRQLRRIGCKVRTVWPPLVQIGDPVDVVFFLIDREQPRHMSCRPDDPALTRVAVIDYENPITLKAVIDSNAHAVIMKPIRPMGILTTLVLARSLHGYENRLTNKVEKLEETLKSQRVIGKATKVLMDAQGLSESEAYHLLRQQAMSKRLSMSVVAHSVIEANEVFARLRADQAIIGRDRPGKR